MTATAEKEVLFFIDFSPTALQTKNNDFLFYRFFKIFSFLPFQKVVIWNLLKNIVVIPLKDKKEKNVLLSSIDFRPIALRKNGRYCCLYEKIISYFKCKM